MDADKSGPGRDYRVSRAGHLVIRCSDPVRTAKFFQEVAGFNLKGVVRRGMHFLTSEFEDNHHMLLVRPSREGATAQDADTLVGMAGVSFELRDPNAFDGMVARLAAHGVTPEVAEDAGRRTLRFHDPDGMPFEFWCRSAAA